MVTKEEGLAFAEEYGCLFLESSAKTRENVEKCFEELALKVCLEKYIRHRNVIHLKPFFLLGLVRFSVNPCVLDVIE
jgi:hypothetical protein